MNRKHGSVLIFSLMIVSLMVLLTQQLVRSVYVGANFVRTMIDRERAEMLALGGLNFVMQTLTVEEKKQDKQDEPEDAGDGKAAAPDDEKNGKKGDKELKKFLRILLPHLNRWQSYDLQEDQDGIEGTLKICITSEHGKININEIFDFEKQEMKKEYQALLGGLEIKGKLKPGQVVEKIIEFLKKRKKKLDDITELYDIKGFDVLSLFYDPPKNPEKKQKAKANESLTLQDIFTVWSGSDKIEPLFLSDALCAILGIRRPLAQDAKQLKEQYKALIKSYRSEWSQNWSAHWKNLHPIYGEPPKVLDQVVNIFSKQFGPKIYSVLSYAKVGLVEQKILAVIKKIEEKKEKDKEDNKDDQKKKEQKDQAPKKSFEIVRVYWL